MRKAERCVATQFATPRRCADVGAEEHKWGVRPATRINHNPLLSLMPVIAILAITIGFNHSTYAQRFYTWLNANYTPFQINSWWTFGITSGVYWIGGLIFWFVRFTRLGALATGSEQHAQQAH